MQALFAVYKREVALYFRSGIAYAIASALLLIVGIVFTAQAEYILVQAQFQQQFGSATFSLNFALRAMLGVFTFLLFLVAPLITMRLLAEESREGTLEVLMTLPMGDWAFVLGKYLAAWTFYSVLLGLTLIPTGMLATMGTLNAGRVLFMYLGTWLYGGATIAVALIWSAVTEDQLVAAFLGAATVLVLILADALQLIVSSGQGAGGIGEVVRNLGLNTHYDTLLDGVVRAEDLTYFVLLIIVALFITTLIVGTRRWRAKS